MKNSIAIISILLNVCLISASLLYAGGRGYLGRFLVMANANYLELPTDTLSSQSWWQDEVKYQVAVTQNTKIKTCIFGDSITSMLGNTLGNDSFNFAIGGMSAISQLEQLKLLTAARIRCERAIVALGTNDAIYRTMDDQFIKNMQQIIMTVKNDMGAKQVVLLPAFYSTVEASRDVSIAAPIPRVDKFNELLGKVAVAQRLSVDGSTLQPLFEGKALKADLTSDGVHLNLEGKKLYREALLKIVDNLDKKK
ncbi:SGNH/GDSL hydrolase family protein [Microcoleus sp. bin38.metabat.b11b12b14.051]|uniref:SGNH/GDSL hydrolase family protein n=1 Tax=Microcoleus sp. bin38.metabat.b11b12b14.051 TaxID=2742709 RepID=UPI0025D61B10|nr:SGNH/GDSL hydrolase family protein [Microcoleus sp. bin38.metabat.b11b12b14.051]